MRVTVDSSYSQIQICAQTISSFPEWDGGLFAATDEGVFIGCQDDEEIEVHIVSSLPTGQWFYVADFSINSTTGIYDIASTNYGGVDLFIPVNGKQLNFSLYSENGNLHDSQRFVFLVDDSVRVELLKPNS